MQAHRLLRNRRAIVFGRKQPSAELLRVIVAVSVHRLKQNTAGGPREPMRGIRPLQRKGKRKRRLLPGLYRPYGIIADGIRTVSPVCELDIDFVCTVGTEVRRGVRKQPKNNILIQFVKRSDCLELKDAKTEPADCVEFGALPNDLIMTSTSLPSDGGLP